MIKNEYKKIKFINKYFYNFTILLSLKINSNLLYSAQQ